MTPSVNSAERAALTVTADLDGCALWSAGEKVEVFDSLWDAGKALRTAEDASRMLAALLNPIPADPHAADTAESFAAWMAAQLKHGDLDQ